MLHGRICTMNHVGAPTLSSYNGMRFGARAFAFAPCKGYVMACFREYAFASIHFRVRVSDMTCRTIGFVLLMYPLYG